VLAQQAFERYRSTCFWFLRDDLRVTEETIGVIVRGLRQYGDRQAFQIAAELCR
jgi:hypothetical protein